MSWSSILEVWCPIGLGWTKGQDPSVAIGQQQIVIGVAFFLLL